MIVIHTVGRISLHALGGGFAVIESDDVVDEGLAGFGERERFGRVGRVVFGGSGLARFEVLAGSGAGGGKVRFVGGGGGGHSWGGCYEAGGCCGWW